MANFAVNASEEIIAQGKDLLEKLAKPGEKQGDVLGRIFKIVAEQQDGETLKQGGIDVQALDSSLANIRTMFMVAVTGKEQIVEEKDGKIAEVKKLKDQMEADFRDKLAAAKTEKEAAIAQAAAAAQAAAQAIKDAQVAKEQAETANNLVAEKDKTIATLADKLTTAEAKADGYDALVKKEAEARDKIKDLTHTLEKQLSDAEKDTALAVAKAVADKEREMTAQILTAEKEIARLQARIDIMETSIKATN